MPAATTRKPVYAVAVWGVLGFAAIVFRAVWSLTPVALAPIRAGTMTALHWSLYIGWLVFMVYSEGYKGFQRKVAPRVAARAMRLVSDGVVETMAWPLCFRRSETLVMSSPIWR